MKNMPSIPLLVTLSWLGFGTAQASLLVQTFNSETSVENIMAADSLISAGSPSTSGSVEIIDYADTKNLPGHFTTTTSDFPGGLTETFALHASGNIFITMAGAYTFGLYHDDGVRLKIDGNNVINFENQAAAQTSLNTIFLDVGAHSLDLVYFENSGDAVLELFASKGERTNFDSTFKLIGDTANGGISTVPLPAAVYLFGTGLLGLIGYKRKQRV
jgi:hypothetical protein